MLFLDSVILFCFLLGSSPASELCMPTFRNTICSVFIGRWCEVWLEERTSYHLPMKMEQIECSETSAYIIQTPGSYPKENIIYSEHGESLKSGLTYFVGCVQEDANVVVVDWSGGGGSWMYWRAVANTRVTGVEVTKWVILEITQTSQNACRRLTLLSSTYIKYIKSITLFSVKRNWKRFILILTNLMH